MVGVNNIPSLALWDSKPWIRCPIIICKKIRTCDSLLRSIIMSPSSSTTFILFNNLPFTIINIMGDTEFESNIKTRFLIISDTHGSKFVPPSQEVDVVIHCGDLTNESKLEEFRTTLHSLRNLKAPLKLVIAGNHDFTLDEPVFRQKVNEAKPPLDPNLVIKEYGDYGQVRGLFAEAQEHNILLLEEGIHNFKLSNGAFLSVYASPFTPSLGDWGFQYHPQEGHRFVMDGVNVAITHGPPKGIMDRTHAGQRAGCPDLFAAIARARPQLHCFGHIHEGWAAKLATWREHPSETPSHFTDIDNNSSISIENLSGLLGSKYDDPETLKEKSRKLKKCERDACYIVDKNTTPQHNQQTLFVNASIQGDEDYPFQLPWIVEIALPCVP